MCISGALDHLENLEELVKIHQSLSEYHTVLSREYNERKEEREGLDFLCQAFTTVVGILGGGFRGGYISAVLFGTIGFLMGWSLKVSYRFTHLSETMAQDTPIMIISILTRSIDEKIQSLNENMEDASIPDASESDTGLRQRMP